MADTNERPDRFLTLNEVRQLTTLSRSSILRQVEEGTFPAPVKIGPNRVAWREGEVRAWMLNRPSRRREQAR